ncbi:hypothetical protein D3C76_1377410 [compost metagenome]
MRRIEVGHGAVEELAVVVLDADTFGQVVFSGDHHGLGRRIAVQGAAGAVRAGGQRAGAEPLGQVEGELAVEHRDFLRRRIAGNGRGGLRIQSPQAGSDCQQQDKGFVTQQ